MRNLIIRSGLAPWDVLPYDELENRIGDNLGNLIYAYGVFRELSADDDTRLFSTHYRTCFTEEEMERINSECDAFIIPLADAIRFDFANGPMIQTTELVRALKIPCIVTGMGVRAPYEPGSDLHFPFDETVRDFMAAVLDKSAIVGVRGEITGDYLSRLGFRAESDFTVIGCPSMYTYGNDLALRYDVSAFDADAKVSFTMSQAASEQHIQFILNNVHKLTDAAFIPQRKEELRLMRTGQPYAVKTVPNYPVRVTDELYRRDNTYFFNSAKSWIDFQRTRNFCFGTRMHGGISAVLAGLPTLFLPFDARTRELVEYHHLTHIPPSELRGDDDLRDWIGKLDFSSHLRTHAANFRHYVDFLNRNELRHIFGNPGSGGGRAFDEKLASVEFLPPFKSITHGSPEQIANQLDFLWRENQALLDRDKKLQLKHEFQKLFAKSKRKLKRMFTNSSRQAQ